MRGIIEIMRDILSTALIGAITIICTISFVVGWYVFLDKCIGNDFMTVFIASCILLAASLAVGSIVRDKKNRQGK